MASVCELNVVSPVPRSGSDLAINEPLNWRARLDIALNAAQGLPLTSKNVSDSRVMIFFVLISAPKSSHRMLSLDD